MVLLLVMEAMVTVILPAFAVGAVEIWRWVYEAE